jgi:hypothetical protein
MSNLENMTLSMLKELEPKIPSLSGFISRNLVRTYSEFVEVLYRDIDRIIYKIQENPELRQNDSEDRLTIDIINLLCMMGYNASHDTKVRGHADILVVKNDFMWIGEAKIHSSYPYLWKGFQQLSTRYSVADSNQKDGGIIIYIRQANAREVMDKWRKHLLKKNLSNYSCTTCEIRKLCFFTSHEHVSSGEPFRIRHMPVILHFKPQDHGSTPSGGAASAYEQTE